MFNLNTSYFHFFKNVEEYLKYCEIKSEIKTFKLIYTTTDMLYLKDNTERKVKKFILQMFDSNNTLVQKINFSIDTFSKVLFPINYKSYDAITSKIEGVIYLLKDIAEIIHIPLEKITTTLEIEYLEFILNNKQFILPLFQAVTENTIDILNLKLKQIKEDTLRNLVLY